MGGATREAAHRIANFPRICLAGRQQWRARYTSGETWFGSFAMTGASCGRCKRKAAAYPDRLPPPSSPALRAMRRLAESGKPQLGEMKRARVRLPPAQASTSPPPWLRDTTAQRQNRESNPGDILSGTSGVTIRSDFGWHLETRWIMKVITVPVVPRHVPRHGRRARRESRTRLPR